MSDKAGIFTSGMMVQFYKLMSIHKVTTAPYNPQYDGKHENSHKFLLAIIRILCEHDPREWISMSRVAMFAWNASPSPELAHLCPFELMSGQMPHLPHELTMAGLESLGGDMTTENYHCYTEYLKEVLGRYSAAIRGQNGQ